MNRTANTQPLTSTDARVPTREEITDQIVDVDIPISQGSGHRISRFLWREVDLDGLIFSKPTHEGDPVDIARNVYHRLAARLVAAQAHKLQIGILAISGVLTLILGGISSGVGSRGSFLEAVALFILITVIGTVAFIAGAVPFLMARSYSPSIREEVGEIIDRTFLRPLPDDTPEDLRDFLQESWLTVDGRPLSSEVSPKDGKSTEAKSVTMWWLLTGVSVGILLSYIFGFGFLGSAVIFSILGAKLVLSGNPLSERIQELDAAEGVEGAAFVAAGGKRWGSIPNRARHKQIEEANRDRTPLVTLGTTTGLLAARGDFFAPNADLPFRMSLRDLQMHVLVLGGTGSGKTSGVLRPAAKQIADLDDTGIVVLDGKGALPVELANLDGMTLIDPKEETLCLISDVDPAIVTDTLVDVLESEESQKDPFFVNSGKGVLRRALVLCRAAGDREYSLGNAGRLITDDEYRTSIINAIDPDTVNAVTLDAGEYFLQDWANMDPRTRTNIVATVSSWLSVLKASPDLLRWVNATPDADTCNLLAPLTGGRIGLVLPDYRYGEAGAAVTALLKARIYGRLKERSERGIDDEETPVVFIVDEAQEVATREDATMLAIGRSLQLSVIAATQTVEGVTERLGPALSRKWFGIYGGVIALPGRSMETDEFVADRGGSQWRPKLSRLNGLTVRDDLTIDAVSGASAAATRQPHLRGQKTGVIENAEDAVQKIVRAVIPERRAATESTVGPTPIVESAEIQTLLAEPNTALAYVTRARVPRRDVIRLTPDYGSAETG